MGKIFLITLQLDLHSTENAIIKKSSGKDKKSPAQVAPG